MNGLPSRMGHIGTRFYREVLPDLRARGRTVIVISHDDRYFGVADRVVRLEGGILASVGPPSSQPRPEPSAPLVLVAKEGV